MLRWFSARKRQQWCVLAREGRAHPLRDLATRGVIAEDEQDPFSFGRSQTCCAKFFQLLRAVGV
jgi:hypothetical protein